MKNLTCGWIVLALLGLLLTTQPLAAAEAAGVAGGRPQKMSEPCLCIVRPDPETRQPRKDFLPLKSTAVTGNIAGMIAEVTVKQAFFNPLTDRLEATYVFPLPDNAAVHSLKITIKDRTIVGEIKTSAAAQQTFDEAREAGHTAALVQQSRENIFTAAVTNIPPGETVIVEITYFQTLTYDDGRYSFHFPMVVAPRYLHNDAVPAPQPGPPPPGVVRPMENDGVAGGVEIQPAPAIAPVPPPVAPVAPGTPPDTRRIQPAGYLNPADKRIGNISLKLNIDAGVGITAVTCPTHEITVNQTGNTTATVELARKDEIPNKDFVLEYKITNAAVQAAVLAHKPAGADVGYFLLMLVPKDEYDSEDILAKEMIYIVDHSGSMGGDKMLQAKLALKSSLHALNPDDTFNIVPFDNRVTLFSETSVPFTQENLDKADAFSALIQAQGGTEILRPMQWTLAQKAAADRLKIVVFLTDGEVSNDEQVVATVQKTAGEARVYTFGIGHGVNRWMLRKMAEYGHGGFETILPGEDMEEKIARFNDRTSYPVLRDVKADFGGLEVKDTYPATMPDLFTSQPIVILGTYTKGGKYKITVGGRTPNGDYSTDLNVDLPDASDTNPGLPVIWARARIEDLNDRMIKAPDQKPLVDEITALGLKFSLITDYTSFVVVEKRTVNKDGKLVLEDVPVPLPEGWKMDEEQMVEKDSAGTPRLDMAKKKTGAPRGGVAGALGGGGAVAAAPPPAPTTAPPAAAMPAPGPMDPQANQAKAQDGQPGVAPGAPPAADAAPAPAKPTARLDDKADGDRALVMRDRQNAVAERETARQVEELATRMESFGRRKAELAKAEAKSLAPAEGAEAQNEFLGDQSILDDQAAMLADVLRALAREQDVDGLWKDTAAANPNAGFATLERSAIAVLCYHRAGQTTKRGKFKAQMERAIDGLIKAQQADGSFLADAPGGLRLQAELTLTLVEVAASRNRDSYRTAATKALDALIKHQRADGLFPATANGDGDKATTAFALLALKRGVSLHLGEYAAAVTSAEKALPGHADELLKELARAAVKTEADHVSNLDRITGMAFYLTFGE